MQLSYLPDKPLLTTAVGLDLGDRQYGTSYAVTLVDGEVNYIPEDGQVSKWQFYTKSPGSVAFQVWRRNGTIEEKRWVFSGSS